MKNSFRRMRVFCAALAIGAGSGLLPQMLAAAPAVAVASASATPGARPNAAAFVARLDLDGAVGPAMAEYVHDALAQATHDGARAIVLRIDTPGGLSSAMRSIIADILAAKIPVIGYVAPGGARAASAGTYILYACHVAAMAPATHLGAATPVSLGGHTPMPTPKPPPMAGHAKKQKAAEPASAASGTEVEGKAAEKAKGGGAEAHKVLNDAIAYIRSLAQLRHRNVQWAEKAVRGAATLTASEAVKQNVVNYVAPDVADVLKQADGRSVEMASGPVTIHGLAGLSVRDYPMSARLRFLSVITNPTVAYGLLMIGIWGLLLEGFHPGAILPGTVGAIALLVGLYALHLLPVNYAGLALMVLGVGMIVAEVLVPSIGAIGLGGIVAFVIGSVMLFDAHMPGYGVNLGVIAAIAVFASGLLFMVLWLLMRSRRRRPTIGDGDELIGTEGGLQGPVAAGGQAWATVHGERWRVESAAALPAGARVRVVGRKGLLLSVEKI